MTTKQKILNEALSLFLEKGYSAVYVGDIAEAVGMKTPSLYKHYKNKQDILIPVLKYSRSAWKISETICNCREVRQLPLPMKQLPKNSLLR